MNSRAALRRRKHQSCIPGTANVLDSSWADPTAAGSAQENSPDPVDSNSEATGYRRFETEQTVARQLSDSSQHDFEMLSTTTNRNRYPAARSHTESSDDRA